MKNNHYKKISGMKRNNINRFFKLGLLSLVVAFTGSSCVKSVSGRTDFENLTPNVLIPDGGIANFGGAAILFPPTDPVDTAFFHLNYAATDVAPQDETITIGVDLDALAAYNALGGNQYAIFPDSIYSFTTTAVTIKKGNNYSDLVPLIMYPDKINLLNNYMLPISIKVAPAGSGIASNFKTIYYHLIGNPIAGVYNRLWVRYNNLAGTGSPAGGSPTNVLVPIAPVDGTTAQAVSGSAGLTYIITFTNTGGVLSNFGVSFLASSVAASGVAIIGGPTIITADPVAGVYKFNYQYDNLAGGLRNITDTYTKQ